MWDSGPWYSLLLYGTLPCPAQLGIHEGPWDSTCNRRASQKGQRWILALGPGAREGSHVGPGGWLSILTLRLVCGDRLGTAVGFLLSVALIPSRSKDAL